MVGDFSVLENDPDLDVVVESIGGAKVALDVEGHALLEHAGEDEVGGAVEDAADFLDLVARQTLEDGPQEGNAPAHTGLEDFV